jgi:hypothetical protein
MAAIREELIEIEWYFTRAKGEVGVGSSWEALVGIAQGGGGDKSKATGPQESEHCMDAAKRLWKIDAAFRLVGQHQQRRNYARVLEAYYTPLRKDAVIPVEWRQRINRADGIDHRLAALVCRTIAAWPQGATACDNAVQAATEALEEAQKALATAWHEVTTLAEQNQRKEAACRYAV